ncbi:hypothetical protein FHR83_007061 [Actinoplanes campanulatus]|uniref:Uncharacterized protein n=1 Tax=Actinoplanes campanulatus TaxID=113559 RepID=A0A7W5FID3_9ACTN|nr:hypothetical protein [Actinoplanes campanulatus]MBB3099355.1 hypothetical protein [Actinoplanes campanulatus]GGN40334.1 hypothetical protein GCM10010109_69310 [Actinoplanes campanulatus]GID40672.1 hypothetical protein Aca09nite_71780 [Actinoplanes campanulatus]
MTPREPGPVRAGAVAAGDSAPGASSPPPVVVAEAEEVTDDPDLVDAFGPVSRWWVGEVPGLGLMRLPLP